MPLRDLNNEFYNELCVETGTTDTKLVREFYRALVRTVKKRLKTVGKIELPGLANIYIYMHASKRRFNIGTREWAIIPAHKMIKMTPTYLLKEEVKEYFKD